MAGLYIHIPFCKQACHYCDFHFSTNQDQRTQLCQAIVKEINLQQSYLANEPIHTLYFGGGTPSLLSAEELAIIFESVHHHFVVDNGAEVTVEANPDDLTPGKLKELKTFGVNRLSIGIQSFNNHTLNFFNRAHSSEQAIESIHQARAAGFDNISIDLIYSVPGQAADIWEKDIQQAIALQPEHISSYSLTIEDKTAFGKWQKTGRIKPLDENKAIADFEVLMDTLSSTGYEHYEISNFSKPGFHSQHNSSYWQQKKYLGLGPSAHSYNGDTRQFNVANNNRYINSIIKGEVPFEIERLSKENKINEYIFTTLRTKWGCDLSYLEKNFGYLMVENPILQKLLVQELIGLNSTIMTLTKKGKLLADQIAVELFVSS